MKRKSRAGIANSTAVASPTAPTTISAAKSRFRVISDEPAREPAVDRDDRARHVRGAVRAEERDDVADLARRAEPAKRDRCEILLARAVRVHLADPVRVDPARC